LCVGENGVFSFCENNAKTKGLSFTLLQIEY